MEHVHHYGVVKTERRDLLVLVCEGCGDNIVTQLPAEPARPAPVFPPQPRRPVIQPLMPAPEPWEPHRYPYRPPIIWCSTPPRHGKTSDGTSGV